MKTQNATRTTTLDFEQIVGAKDIICLDDILKLNNEFKQYHYVPASFVNIVINQQLSSKKYIALIKKRLSSSKETGVMQETHRLSEKIPSKLYFFFWCLKNRELVPREGMLSTEELHRSIYYLFKIITLLELNLQKFPKSVPMYENLGTANLELARMAQQSNRGLRIQGEDRNYPALLRKSIACFQHAIKIEASLARKIDCSHEFILKLINNRFSFKDDRIRLYLNPWHFLYIAAALRALNDRESEAVYLEHAKQIIDLAGDHQNPDVVNQKVLLNALYILLKRGDSVAFDLDHQRIQEITQKIRRLQQRKTAAKNGAMGYSPIVEQALGDQYRLQYSFLKDGMLNVEQMEYLRAVYALYSEIPSGIERDRCIFRLNIPPLNVKGQNKMFYNLLKGNFISAPQQAYFPSN